jgi:hypothetical protein
MPKKYQLNVLNINPNKKVCIEKYKDIESKTGDILKSVKLKLKRGVKDCWTGTNKKGDILTFITIRNQNLMK